MRLYYVLNCDEYEGEKAQIGDIMRCFSAVLYDKTKLNLGSLAGPIIETIEHQMENTGLEILLEEVMWKNMTESEKAAKFLEYIKSIGGISGDLLILDPYIFCGNADKAYKKLLNAILIGSEYKSLKIITSKSHYSPSLFEETKRAVGKDIDVVFSDEFHDRLWIANDKKGFISGTSLNGVGKRYSIISPLDENDVLEIVKMVRDLVPHK